jgi:hypothetical protein
MRRLDGGEGLGEGQSEMRSREEYWGMECLR